MENTNLDPNPRFCHGIRIPRKVPMTDEDMSLCEEHEPVAKSSNLDSKASFPIPSIVSQQNSLLLIGATKDQALDLAKEILGNSSKVDSGNHPDLHLYAPEGKAELHPIANIHQMIEEMSLPPFEAKSKVFILEGAEKMLPSSSNALLKTLEEPNPDTYFLLLSDHPDRLLPTVRSRLYPIDYKKPESAATDFSHYIALAEAQRWDRLLEELPDEGTEDFFKTCLKWAAEKRSPSLFLKVSNHIEQAEKALQHNVKPRTVFLNLLLQIAPDVL